MLIAAADALNLDLSGSVMMGDRLTDLEAGDAAGVAAGVHVLTGYGAKERAGVLRHRFGRLQLREADSIADAPTILASL
jgi:D-glycero-D-manno-heptose 1,7-bisphosphate phosphatase